VDEPGDPEGKIVKNRTPDDEVERILALGAKLYEDHRTAEGLGWVTLRVPRATSSASREATANASSRRAKFREGNTPWLDCR
jgi:hypothetical protein